MKINKATKVMNFINKKKTESLNKKLQDIQTETKIVPQIENNKHK